MSSMNSGEGHSSRSTDTDTHDATSCAETATTTTRRPGFQYPEDGPLLNTDFTGGEHSVKARLERLGFDVVARPALAAADTLPLREAIEAALIAQQRRTPSQWSDDLQKVVAVQLPQRLREPERRTCSAVRPPPHDRARVPRDATHDRWRPPRSLGEKDRTADRGVLFRPAGCSCDVYRCGVLA